MQTTLRIAGGLIAAALALTPGASAAQGSASAPLNTRPARPAASSATSLNSAGYVVSRVRTRFRFVRATYFVPYLNCRLSPGSYSADWVGLDGFVGSPDSVEQIGVAANCSATGKAAYHAWFAMYPHARKTLRVHVRPGDSVTARVYYSQASRTFTLDLVNNTTGGHSQVHATCPSGISCPRTSAEIITSTLTTGSGSTLKIRPLAAYGAVSFTGIAITDRSGQRGSVRSAHWGATRIVETERAAPFRVTARPTLVQGTTFATYWARAS